MSINYPIAIDDNYAIWHAFGNEYWPALYIIDAQGESGIINSEKEITRSRKGLFSNC
jgi:hypothetical protein